MVVYWQPSVNAELTLDGRAIKERPARVKVPRSERPAVLRVQAPGFEVAKLKVVPDQDRDLIVPLTRKRAPEAARPAATSQASSSPATDRDRQPTPAGQKKPSPQAATRSPAARPVSYQRWLLLF